MKITHEIRTSTIEDGADIWDGAPRLLAIFRNEAKEPVFLVRSEEIKEGIPVDDHHERMVRQSRIANFHIVVREKQAELESELQPA